MPSKSQERGENQAPIFFQKIRSDYITQASFSCANKLEPSPKHLDICGFPKIYTRKIYIFSKTSDLITASHSFSCAMYMAYPKKTAKNHERPQSCLAAPNIAWASCTSQAHQASIFEDDDHPGGDSPFSASDRWFSLRVVSEIMKHTNWW